MKINFWRFWCLPLTLVCLFLTLLAGLFWKLLLQPNKNSEDLWDIFCSIWSNVNNFPKIDSIVNIKIFQNWKLLPDSKYTCSPTFFEPSEIAVERPMMCNITYYLHTNQVLLWTIHVRCLTIGGGCGRNGISILCLLVVLGTVIFFICHYLSLKITISKIISVLRYLLHIV